MNKAQRPLAQSIQDARKYESWFWALIIEVMEGAGLHDIPNEDLFIT